MDCTIVVRPSASDNSSVANASSSSKISVCPRVPRRTATVVASRGPDRLHHKAPAVTDQFAGYAAVDTETTCISPDYRNRITEIAIIHVDTTGAVTDR